MKKVWQIRGTKEFHDNKEALKLIRNQMNAEAGYDFPAVLAEKKGNVGHATALMPFKITKGPEHPLYQA